MASGHEGSGRGAGLEGPNRETPCRLGDDRSPGRGHEKEPAGEPERREPVLEPFDVTVEHRLGVGVHRRGGPALVLAHVREDVGGARDVQPGKLATDERPGRLLVSGVGVGVEEADGERLDGGRVDQIAHRLAYLPEIQRLDHRAVGRDAFTDLPAAAARDERIGPSQPEVEQVVALLEAHVEEVPEPFGHQHPRRRPAPLDDRVGDEGGAVGDRVDLGHRDVLAGEQGGRALDHRDRGVGWRGEPLVDRDPAATLVEQGEVGKRSSDVHAEPVGHGQGSSFHRLESCRARCAPGAAPGGGCVEGGRAEWWRATGFQNNIAIMEASEIAMEPAGRFGLAAWPAVPAPVVVVVSAVRRPSVRGSSVRRSPVRRPSVRRPHP